MTSSLQGDEDIDPRAQERVGTVLDEKWTLERILGAGGMGAVYAGLHRNGARGAVKVLHPELARRADVRERFLREGYAANRVDHRGAVRVLDDDVIKDGPDEGTAYLVMEMLEGESLEHRIEKGAPVGEAELLQILDDVLLVLEAAHTNGVVHRDLKPANLWLNADPAGHPVKVLDFGLARLDEGMSVTHAGIPLGTPSFMAPEQALGAKDQIDGRTDLFALGATAFMILADRGVHEADGVIELVARMGTMPAPKLRDVQPLASETLARIVDRALEFERDHRYPNAAAMRADVAAARNEGVQTSAAVTLVGAPSVPPPRPDAVEAAAPLSLPPTSAAPPSRGGSRLLFALGLAGVVAGVSIVLIARFRPLPETPNAIAALAATAEPANANASDAALLAVAVAVAVEGDADAAADAATDAAAEEEEEDDDEEDGGAAPAASAASRPASGAHPVTGAKKPTKPTAPKGGKPKAKKKKKPKR